MSWPGMFAAEAAVMHDDPCDLRRFTRAQETIYASALAEISSGRKKSHWMWFVFPQMLGLGNSPTSLHFAIKGRDEARQYLMHPVLGTRLRECADAVLAIEDRSIAEVFGHPDDLKLKSSMTLFETVAGQGSVFSRVLDKFFQGERDSRTLDLLKIHQE